MKKETGKDGGKQKGGNGAGFHEMPEDDADEQASQASWRFHGVTPQAPLRWCIKGILPETGFGILAGQWGTFKTTIALELSLSAMTGLAFADRYRVKRPGAALYFALEGAGMLGVRLSALATQQGIPGPLPFVWQDKCPPLTSPNAATIMVAMIRQAEAEILRLYKLPIALIWIDTIATAAGYLKSGDDNDAAMTQMVMNTLSAIARQTGAFVIGVDHFGKIADAGTRGSSAKEGAVDVVLGSLGERELSGLITNTRLVLRKQREGISGVEIPYTAEIIETGRDEDGDAETAVVLKWNTPTSVTPGEAGWPKGLRLFRRILIAALVATGQEMKPDPDKVVRAVHLDVVRMNFYRVYPGEGDEAQRKAARQKAFVRALKDAQARNLVGCCETDGVQWVWVAEEDG